MNKTYKQIVREMNDLNEKINNAKAEEREALQQQFDQLKREAEIAREAQQAENLEREAQNLKPQVSVASMREMISDVRKNGNHEYVLGREGETAGVSLSVLAEGKTNNITTAKAVPTSIKELLPLLDNAIVYSQLGINIATGVSGNIVWPVLAAGTAVSVNGEAATIADSEVDFSKVEATPKRLGVTTTITYEALDNAAFDVQSVVTQNITHALSKYLNEAVLRTTTVSGGLNGPLTATGIETAALSKVPTFAELIAMKGKVAKNNVQMTGAAFVMNNDLYALLESTPKAEGQGGFIIENGKIGNYPVFVTEAIAANKIAFGCFGYAALNNHGETRLAVENEPVKGGIRITLNSNWSLTTLRAQAFCLGTVAQ